MVATDVASRGIGMTKQNLLPSPTPCPLPIYFPLQFLPLPSCDMVPALFDRYAYLHNVQASCLFGPSPKGTLDPVFAV
jgi:hypothetical protein